MNYHSEEAFQSRLASRRAQTRRPSPFAAFYHVACLNNWREVFEEQCRLLEEVGLKATACVLGENAAVKEVSKRLGLAYTSTDLSEYETPTLERLWKWCLDNSGGAVLYFHTKGVSAPDDANKAAWRQLMGHWVIRGWRENLESLAVADCVGVDWQDDPHYPHFSGNFWMARADWIAHLESPADYRGRGGPRLCGNPWERMAAEMWLGSKPYHEIKSLCCRNRNLWSGPEVFRLLEAIQR